MLFNNSKAQHLVFHNFIIDLVAPMHIWPVFSAWENLAGFIIGRHHNAHDVDDTVLMTSSEEKLKELSNKWVDESKKDITINCKNM